MLTLAAVDLGAQSGRVAVGHFDGDRLHVEEIHRIVNEPVLLRGRLHWDISRLYGGVLDGLRVAARDNTIAAIGVDSWGVDFGLLDRHGRLIQDPAHYRDPRRASAYEAVLERVPAIELYERTGIQLMPINTIFQLAAMALDGDGALAAGERMLLIADLVHYWLSGSTTTEHTNATTTQCLDAHTGVWAYDLLERLGIPMRIFSELVMPGTMLGQITSDVADESGLHSTQLIATASHDTAAAVVAVPFENDRAAFLSIGTWSLVGVENDKPNLSEAAARANLSNEGGFGGSVRLLRNVAGLWLLHECRRAWEAEGRRYSYEALLALAMEAAPHRSFIDPNASAFSEPGKIPGRIAEFCRQTDQPVPSDDGAFVRCILESLALKQAETVDVLADVTGRKLEQLHVVGGGAKNELLCQWTADASGRPVLAGPTEATLVGNLLVQAIALGELASLTEARDLVRRSFVHARYEPRDQEAWIAARARFAALGEA